MTVPATRALSARKMFPYDPTRTQAASAAEQAKIDYTCLIVCNDLNIVVRASMPQEFMFDTSSSYEAPFSQGMMGMLPAGIGTAAKAVGLQLATQAMSAQIWQGSSTNQFQIPLTFQVETDINRDVLEPLMKLMFLTVAREEDEGGLLSAPGPHIDLKSLVSNIGAELGEVSSGAMDSFTRARTTGETPILDKAKDYGGRLTSALTKTDFTQFMKVSADIALDIKNGANATVGRGSRAISSSIKNNISLYIGRYMYFPSVVIKDVQQTHSVQPLRDGNYSRVEVTVAFETFFQPTQRDISTMFPSASSALRSAIDAQAGPQAANNTAQSVPFYGTGAAPY
jgi:hypothetical protein